MPWQRLAQYCKLFSLHLGQDWPSCRQHARRKATTNIQGPKRPYGAVPLASSIMYPVNSATAMCLDPHALYCANTQTCSTAVCRKWLRWHSFTQLTAISATTANANKATCLMVACNHSGSTSKRERQDRCCRELETAWNAPVPTKAKWAP